MRAFVKEFCGVSDDMLEVSSGEGSFWASIIVSGVGGLCRSLFEPSFKLLGKRLAKCIEQRLPHEPTPNENVPQGSLSLPYKDLKSFAEESGLSPNPLLSGMDQVVEHYRETYNSVDVSFSTYDSDARVGRAVRARSRGDQFQLQMHRTDSLEDIHRFIRSL